MAKRFTDTDKWKKKWFRKLPVEYKVLWQYLTDNCDKCGIWEVDFELAEIFIGKELDVEKVKNEFKKQFIELDNGKRWFIKDFIEFQYGTLNPNNPAHKNVYKELLGRNLLNKDGTLKELPSPSIVPLQGAKAKDKEKEETKEEIKEEEPEIIPDEEIEGVKYFGAHFTNLCGDNEGLRKAWLTWINYNHCRGKPVNQITAVKQLKFLREQETKKAIEIIELAIINQWSGLKYENSKDGKSRNNNPLDMEKGKVSKERIEASLKKFYQEE